MSTKLATVAPLRVARLIKAPREQVFAAWTSPEAIKQWFAPEPSRVLAAEADLRVGGQYHMRVHSHCDSGQDADMDLQGVYREVRRPSRLVYTWNWKGSAEMEFGETLVTVDFVDKEGFTEVQLTHTGFPNDEVREKHNYGWNGCLDKLEKVVAKGSAGQGCPEPGAFCWNEMMAKDPGQAANFYTTLFGWQTEEMPGMNYRVFKHQGKPVGGLMAEPSPEAAPHWLAYVMVEDVDATAKKAAGLGAKMCLPPTDIPNIGRIAVFQDPQQAALGIFQPAKK